MKSRGRPYEPVGNGAVAEVLTVDLRRLISRRRFKVRDLAKQSGYSPATVSRALAGRRIPTREVFDALIRACGEDPFEWADRYEQADRMSKADRAANSGDAMPEKTPVAVAVVDSFPFAIHGMHAWAAADPLKRIQVISSGDDLRAIMDKGGADADVVITDIVLGGVNVIDRIATMAAEGRRVVIFSLDEGRGTVSAVLAAGASCFISKKATAERVIDTVVAVAHDLPHPRSFLSADRGNR